MSWLELGLPHIYNCPAFSQQDPLSDGAVKKARPQDAVLRGGQGEWPPVTTEPPYAPMSWVTLCLEISAKAELYHPLKPHGHTFPLCLALYREPEEVSGAWSHPFRPRRQMERDIRIWSPPFVFRALLAFPSGSWRLWPKVSLANTLCFPQLTLPRNDIYASRWGLSSCPNCVLSWANPMTLENTNSE